MSNASKGNYYKLRTKKWLEKKGYQVAFLERVMSLFTPRGIIHTKKDQFGSDLLAVSADELIFVQVKLNQTHNADALKEFAKYTFPKFTQQWIVVWTPKAREPEIVEYATDSPEA